MNSDHNSTEETAIFFDILGKYIIVFRMHYAEMVYKSAMLLSVLLDMGYISINGKFSSSYIVFPITFNSHIHVVRLNSFF